MVAATRGLLLGLGSVLLLAVTSDMNCEMYIAITYVPNREAVVVRPLFLEAVFNILYILFHVSNS